MNKIKKLFTTAAVMWGILMMITLFSTSGELIKKFFLYSGYTVFGLAVFAALLALISLSKY